MYRFAADGAVVAELDAGERAMRVHRVGHSASAGMSWSSHRRPSEGLAVGSSDGSRISSVQTTAQPPSAFMPRIAASAPAAVAHAVAMRHLVEAVARGDRADRPARTGCRSGDRGS